ncbi:MAG TPA: TspO/MBR family protein [Sphingomicrobium sp.]|jgi:tryptophan-rich sensory protein
MAEATRKRSMWNLALVCVLLIEVGGGISGWLSNSGYDNGWFARLDKPSFMPPGWAFGVVWPILYAMLGVALAMVLAEPESDRRRIAVTFFFAQLALNFAWSPIFFAAHDIELAQAVIITMIIVAAITAGQFYRIRRAAGLLMVPYLCWLVFAATLNGSIAKLNPNAGTSLLGI